tara:strand:- start:198 stop:671 length:474 start_codon:yes stop_codon:yes gene_type:complete
MKNRNLSWAYKTSDNWKTPLSFYSTLDKEFNFDFDPCPYNELDLKFDGLNVEWGNRNFVNPPYSKKLKDEFVKKAIEESRKGKLCVLLLPVSTSTILFHDHIVPNASEIRFVKKRILFEGYNSKGEWVSKNAGMHDSMIVILDSKIASSLRINTFVQ